MAKPLPLIPAPAASTYAVRAKTLHWNEAASMALTIFPASAAHSPIRSTAWESSSCRRPQSVRRSRSASAAPLTSSAPWALRRVCPARRSSDRRRPSRACLCPAAPSSRAPASSARASRGPVSCSRAVRTVPTAPRSFSAVPSRAAQTPPHSAARLQSIPVVRSPPARRFRAFSSSVRQSVLRTSRSFTASSRAAASGEVAWTAPTDPVISPAAARAAASAA